MDPTNPESVATIELTDSGFVTWGAGFDIQGVPYYHFQKYNDDGTYDTIIPYYFNP
ncbi:MAG: hypothetical protein HKN45_06020, partial [Flavobacteriales bacterium]|nr:hypothetical protein [Flavobacteriales bacterium]